MINLPSEWQGTTFKLFCSYPGCTNEAFGDIELAFEDGETFDYPICDQHKQRVLDKPFSLWYGDDLEDMLT